MKIRLTILSFLIVLNIAPVVSSAQSEVQEIGFDFYGDTISFSYDRAAFLDFQSPLSYESIDSFYKGIRKRDYSRVFGALSNYKQSKKPDDWLYYQLIRKVAQHLSPKAENYHRYTLYKWYFLTNSGYDATLSIAGDRLLFYVQSDENIYNIPYRVKNGKQYVCLNYHDYGGHIDFAKIQFSEVAIPVEGATKGFSYRVKNLPDFRPGDYLEKDIRFSYNDNDYYFKVKLNPQIKNIFANYPVVDYEAYFNIPLSRETYRSLIPLLRKNVKGLSTKNGIDYLMRFTRYAFLFETDSKNFGGEKRLTPEQTLLYEQSDCEDRSALLFYLIKEIYNLPTIVLVFSGHVTIAVKLEKPVGEPIVYNGDKFTVCEATPQKEDLEIGELLPKLMKEKFEVVYAYYPENANSASSKDRN